MIQTFFNGIGNISKHGSRFVHFRVESVKDLASILNHFDNYPLITKKSSDYILFKKAYSIVLHKEHLTMEGLLKFVAIKASINLGLSDSLKEAFPNITGLDKPMARDVIIQNPQWLAGFASGEGCFFIKITESPKAKLGLSIQLIFHITQHTRDEGFIRSLVMYLNCGRISKHSNVVDFEVTKFSDLRDKIVPFFKDYPVLGFKSLDFSN